MNKPFVNKGTVHDFWDIGIPGINNEELDLENQCHALENFDFLKGENPEMQKAIYEGIVSTWKIYKQKTSESEPLVGGPSNAGMMKLKSRKMEIVKETPFVTIYFFSLSKRLLSYLIFRICDSTESSHRNEVTLGRCVLYSRSPCILFVTF